MDAQGQRVIAALRAARAVLGWSQDDLAERSGVAQATIARTETGRASPRLSTISRLAETFEAAGVRFIDGSPQGGVTVVADSTVFLDANVLIQDAIHREAKLGQSEAPAAQEVSDSSMTSVNSKAGKSRHRVEAPTPKHRKKIGITSKTP